MPAATVLVVDDDEGFRSRCRATLEAARIAVASAPDGPQAVDRFRTDRALRDRCDLVLLDHRLPRGSGLAVFGALRREKPDLAGILLTGHGSLDVAVEALNLGFSQVLLKPVDAAGLVQAVESTLDGRRALLENERLGALTRLYESLNQLSVLDDPDDLHDCIVRLAVRETSADSASLMLLDRQRRTLRIAAAVGLEGDLDSSRRPLGPTVSGWVVQHGVTVEIMPGKAIPQVVREALRRPEVKASVCLPLSSGDRPVGVLNLNRFDGGAGFGPGDVEVAAVLASDAALSIERLALLRERARSERVAAVGRLASTIIHDLRGPITVIRGAAELIEDLAPAAAPVTGGIERQVDELDRMCQSLLSFARAPGRGRPVATDVRRLLEELRERVPEAAGGTGPEIEVTAPAGLRVPLLRDELVGALGPLVQALAARPCQLCAGLEAEEVLVLTLRGQTDVEWGDGRGADGTLSLALAILRYVIEHHHGDLRVQQTREQVTLTVRLPCYAS